MKSLSASDSEAQRLHLLHELRLLGPDLDPALLALARLVRRHTGRPIGGICVVDADVLRLSAMDGLHGILATPRAQSFCDVAIRGTTPFEVLDARADPRFVNHPLVDAQPGQCAYAGLPLWVAGHCIGTLCAIDLSPTPLSEAAHASLADLALLVTELLEARLQAERRRQNAEHGPEGHQGATGNAGQHAVTDAVSPPIAGVDKLPPVPPGRSHSDTEPEGTPLTYPHAATPSPTAQAARLRAVLAALPDLWFIADRDGTYLECSDAMHPWLVQPFDALRGRRFDDVLPSEVAARAMQGMRAALAGAGVQRLESRLHCRDGVERDFEARIAPMPEGHALFLLRDLTELRRLERDMQLLQRVIEAEAALPMVVADATQPDLPLIFANAAFERLTGYPRAEVLGRNCRFLQDGDDNREALDVLRKALAAGRDCSITLLNRRRDGTRFVNELHIAPVRDELGQLTHYIGVQYDVTARTRAARQLELSEALYRSVAEAISDGLIVVDAAGSVVAANASACTLLGFAAKDLQGRLLTSLGLTLRHDDGQPLTRQEHPAFQALRLGLTRRDRLLRLCRAGEEEELLLSINAQPLRPFGGPQPSAAVITFRDVTAVRRAEQARAAAEARWQFALDGAGEGVWDFDDDSGRVFFSARWKAMLGYADDEIGDGLSEWTRRIHPEDKPIVMNAVARYRSGGSVDYRTEHRLRHKDGHWIWVLDRGKIVERRPDGSARRVVGTHTDITRQREIEHALSEQRAAELASRAKSEFLSRMSHEMRTPLNAVLGFSQLLEQHGTGNAQLQRYTGHILHASRHLLALIDDVLDLQQVEEGRLLLSPQPLPLHDAVATALALLVPQIQARGLRVGATIDPGVWVHADAKRLHQVLLNILSNGIKYNRENGTLRCSLGTDAPTGVVRLCIDDSGAGLSDAQVHRLFQPFERLGFETSSIEGTGLGLIIARRLMQEMGGCLELTSTPGVGTRVTLELPRAAAVGAVDSLPTIPSAGADLAPMRLLYVEDNPLNALLFTEAIGSREGIELRLAGDGQEAFERLDGWQPDVLVLDARLPGLSGYDLLERLRERPELAATPAFMCSADAMPEDLQRAAAAGFVGYWTKPIDIERVIRDLASLSPAP